VTFRPTLPSHPHDPLVTGDAAAGVRAAVREIATAVARREPSTSDPSLASGSAGTGLFLATAAAVLDDPWLHEAADARLDHARDALAEVPLGAALYSGLPGVAWVLANAAGVPEDGDGLEEIDALLAARAATTPWVDHYDLVFGLAGVGTYALGRLPRADARRCVEEVVARLAELAVDLPGGTAWHTPYALLPGHQQAMAPDGLFNLGAAHGIPGILGFLAGACAADVARGEAAVLLERGVEWLLRQRLVVGGVPWLPPHVRPGARSGPARAAWCYGNPGVAPVLLQASAVTGEPRWANAALELAAAAAALPYEETRVVDAGLCHGAAGLLHLYHRLFQDTGDERLGAAARAWVGHTLALRGRSGVAGFRAWMPVEGVRNDWVADPGFLTGASGVGLALLAAVEPSTAGWDALLLASAPRAAVAPA
jgi:lantibiotic biosynthesis protein